MNLRSHIGMATMSLLITATVAVTAAEASPGQGRGHRPQSSAPVTGETLPLFESFEAIVEDPAVTVEAPDVALEEVDIDLSESGAEGAVATETPLAIEAGQSLPPGLQRQVDDGRGLPPGLSR